MTKKAAKSKTPAVVEDPRLASVEQELSEEEEDYNTYLSEIEKMVVATAEDREFAGELLVEVDANLKKMTNRRTWLTKPMMDALERGRTIFRAPIRTLESAKKLLKSKIAKSLVAEEEAQDKELEEAARTGDMSHVGEGVIAVPTGTQVRRSWEYRVVDESKIPREFLMPNYDLIGDTVKEYEDKTNIPGIEAYQDTKVQVSGQRKK